MGLDVILNIIRELKVKYDNQPETDSFRSRLEIAYFRYVLNRLESIFTQFLESSTQLLVLSHDLEIFLSENWSLINGTMFAYTALPHADVTDLLIKVSIFVAEQKNNQGCLVIQTQFLPDNISENDFNSVYIRLVEENDFRAHWLVVSSLDDDVIQDCHSGYIRLINDKQNALYYKKSDKQTRLFLSRKQLVEIDQMLLDIKPEDVIASEIVEKLRVLPQHPNPINALYYCNKQYNTMNILNVSQDNLAELDARISQLGNFFAYNQIPEYFSITPVSALKLLMPTILLTSFAEDYPDIGNDFSMIKTHILSSSGLSLLPVKLMSSNDFLDNKIINPYDVNDNPMNFMEYECSRLISHSSLTQAIATLKHEYELIAHDTSNLLGQLKQLCRQLSLNDAHGGLGEQDNAASGAYPAIIYFMEYYAKIDESQKVNIPPALTQEINLLFELITDHTKNSNAVSNLETCIGTRKEHLITAMQNHEQLLSEISISGENKLSCLSRARADLSSAQLSLEKAITSDTYLDGYDRLGINKHLIEFLNVDVNVTSYADFQLIRTLTESDLNELFLIPLFKQQVISQFNNINDLVLFITEQSRSNVIAILQNIGDELLAKLIFRINPKCLNMFLGVLDLDKLQLVCVVLKNQLVKYMCSESKWNQIKDALSPEQYTIFKNVIMRQNYDSIHAFIRILSIIPTSDRDDFFNLNKTTIANMIRSSLDWNITSLSLRDKYMLDLFHMIKHRIQDLIIQPADCKHILYVIKKYDEPIDFYGTMTDWYLAKITTLNDLIKFMPNIIPKEIVKYIITSTSVANELQEQLRNSPEFLSSIDKNLYILLLPYIFNDYEQLILQNMQINSVKEFKAIMRPLDIEARTIICKHFKNKLVSLIIDVEYETIFHKLFYLGTKDPRQNAQNFSEILELITPEQRTEIYEATKPYISKILLPYFIDNDFPICLLNVLKHLTPDQCFDVCNSISPDKLQFLFSSFVVFKKFIDHFDSRDMVRAIINGMKTRVFDLIHPPIVLRFFSSEQIDIIYDAIKHELFVTGYSLDDLCSFKDKLRPEQYQEMRRAQNLRLIQNEFGHSLATKVERILQGDDLLEIKSMIDEWIWHVKQHKYNACYLFSNTESMTAVIKILSLLEEEWLNKVKQALGLENNEDAYELFNHYVTMHNHSCVISFGF